MFKQHRIEIITFAVALAISGAVFIWLEFQKPGNGIFSRSADDGGVRHKDSGELLLDGRDRWDAVVQYAADLRNYRKALELPADSEARNGNRELAAGYADGNIYDAATGADLSGIRLSNLELSGIIIRDADLTETDFRESLVMDANFEGSDFSEADLSLANLSRANLTRTNLRGVQFVGTTAQETQFRDADLRGANFFGADFRKADFSGANLEGVIVGGSARLAGVVLTGAQNVPDELRALAGADATTAASPDQ